jgi:putative transposase
VLLERVAGERGGQVVAREVMADQVHLLVRAGPTGAPGSVVRAFTRRTARVLRQEFAHLGNHATVRWSPSYFAAWVGDVWELRVRRCIGHRWDAVIAS